MLAKYSNYQKKIEILKKEFFLDFQQDNFFQKAINDKFFCIYSNSKLIKNLEKKLSMKEVNSNTEIISKLILSSLNCLLTKDFMQPSQINILSIKKINLLHFHEIEFAIYSTTNNILNFINEIIKLKKTIIIHSFKLQPLNKLVNHNKQNAIFSLIFYDPNFYINYNLDFSKVIKGRKSNKLLFDEEIVNEYSFKKMKMLGFMSDNNNKYFGFIGLPNKKICKISFGDYLGIEQGEVVGIYPDKIIIKNNLSKEIISLSNKFKKLTYDKNFS